MPIYILGYTYRYIKGYIGRSSREIECILKGGKERKGGRGFFEVIISSVARSLLYICMEAWQNIQYSI